MFSSKTHTTRSWTSTLGLTAVGPSLYQALDKFIEDIYCFFFAGPGRPMGYWIECTWLHLSYLWVLQMRIWILYIPTCLPGTDCITYMTLDILCLVFVHVSIYKFKYIGECAIGIYWAPLVPRGTVNSNIMSFRLDRRKENYHTNHILNTI